MKKLLILLLALTAIAWAEIEIEVAVRIENLPEKILDLDGFSSQNEYCAELEKNACFASEEILCPMLLDVNILYGWPYYGNIIEFYILTGASHALSEAVQNEFNYYRKCGIMVADDSTYNSIFLKIDSVLIPAINDCLQKKNCSTKPLIFDFTLGEMQSDWRIPGPDYELIEMATDSVNARNAAISQLALSVSRHESVRVQNHQLTVSPKLIGRQFMLFDVNGHELRRGTLQNNMQLPAYPTVIKIQGFGTNLLK